MSKLDNIEYSNKLTGEIISKEMVNSIIKEEKTKEIKSLYNKLDNCPETLTSSEIERIVKYRNQKLSSIKEYDLFEEYYTGNKTKLKEAVDTLSDAAYKCFTILVLKWTTCENTLQYNNGINIIKDKDIADVLNISISKWYTVKKELLDFGALRKVTFEKKQIYKINPMIVQQAYFKYDKVIFDLFHDYIKESLSYFNYLKVKSKFYEVNHDIVCKNIDSLNQKVPGIYRLYKDEDIIYIGKSKCIKSRIKEHLKEKDIDSFDFTILDNESDKNIYEIYYIDKYKPIMNRDCVESSNTNLELKKLIFSDRIIILKEDNMSKLDRVGFHLIDTGEVIENGREIYDSLVKEDIKNKYIEIYRKLEKEPESLSLIEIEFILKKERIPMNKIGRFSNYHQVNEDFDLLLFEKGFSPTVYYNFKKLITYYCSHTYTLQYSNNKNITKDISIAKELGISSRAWRDIKGELIKHNMLKLITFDGDKYYKINPCYIGKKKIMTENTYDAFRDDIIKYNLMTPIQILYWDKLLSEEYGKDYSSSLYNYKGQNNEITHSNSMIPIV